MAERAPADGWLVEQGIGEERALLYRAGHAVATQIRWPGGLEPGLVADGKGGADEEGFLAGVPVNHGAEGGQADHEGAEAERAALGKGAAKRLEVLYE